jgi:uncharacterized protein
MSDDPDCLGMCAVDGEVCTGCGRTLDEIDAARGGSGDAISAACGGLGEPAPPPAAVKTAGERAENKVITPPTPDPDRR